MRYHAGMGQELGEVDVTSIFKNANPELVFPLSYLLLLSYKEIYLIQFSATAKKNYMAFESEKKLWNENFVPSISFKYAFYKDRIGLSSEVKRIIDTTTFGKMLLLRYKYIRDAFNQFLFISHIFQGVHPQNEFDNMLVLLNNDRSKIIYDFPLLVNSTLYINSNFKINKK